MEKNDRLELGQFDLELLQRVARSENAADLQDAATSFCTTFGFARWIYGAAGPDLVLTNYPRGWVESYLSNAWHRGSDPVIGAIQERGHALHWDLRRSQPLGKPLDAVQQKILGDRWCVGIRHGITAPIFDGESRAIDFGVLSFSRESPLTTIEHQHHEPRVQLFATYFHSVAPALLLHKDDKHIRPLPKLSPREYDCLSWAAKGKSNWEASRLLNISVPTVAFHLSNAARKLDARGRTAAIARAIRLNLIDPI